MSVEQRLKVALGLLVAAAACVLGAVWSITAHEASVRAFALVPLGCGVALLVAVAYSLLPSSPHLRYWLFHRPLHGPRSGAHLPR